jgi:hypothetical protein
MKQYFLHIAAVVLICSMVPAQAVTLKEGSKSMHLAVEAAAIKFYLQADLTGLAIARQCQNCKPINLRVTPKMSVVDSDHKPINWDASFDIGARLADIIYFPESKVIAKIIVYGKWD